MKRVAITGATGFVGKPLVAALASRGYRVRAGTRDPAPMADGVDNVAYGDLSQRVDWTPLVEGMDAVVHLAGVAHTEGVPEERYAAVNLAATESLAAAVRRAGVGHLVFVSSVRAQSGPSAAYPLTEAHAPAPMDAYGRSKLAAEEAIRASGAGFTILRPALVYGPAVKGNLAALLRLAQRRVPLPLGALSARRSLCGLDGLIDAVDLVLRDDRARGQVFVVADRAPIDLPAMIGALRRGLGRRPGLVAVPAVLMKWALIAAGRRGAWDRLGGDLIVDPARLIGLGWTPPETADGLAALSRAGWRVSTSRTPRP